MKNIKLLLTLFLSITFYQGYGQLDNALKDVMHPAPNAASLGKYGDIPVGYHTGVPNISIPIHSLSEGKVSTGVSLSYHASGVKVEETSSWVGLGWSLNAGGIISRTVKSAPDEGSRFQQEHGYYSDYGVQLPDPCSHLLAQLCLQNNLLTNNFAVMRI